MKPICFSSTEIPDNNIFQQLVHCHNVPQQSKFIPILTNITIPAAPLTSSIIYVAFKTYFYHGVRCAGVLLGLPSPLKIYLYHGGSNAQVYPSLVASMGYPLLFLGHAASLLSAALFVIW